MRGQEEEPGDYCFRMRLKTPDFHGPCNSPDTSVTYDAIMLTQSNKDVRVCAIIIDEAQSGKFDLN